MANVMACFNEYFRTDRDKNPKQATKEYSFLSEFCHPNSFAFTNHIEMERCKPDRAVQVEFAKPDRQACIQVLPSVVLGCMPLLYSMDQLLSRIGDDGFRMAATEYTKISESPAA